VPPSSVDVHELVVGQVEACEAAHECQWHGASSEKRASDVVLAQVQAFDLAQPWRAAPAFFLLTVCLLLAFLGLC
jgi:hypothetical protein